MWENEVFIDCSFCCAGLWPFLENKTQRSREEQQRYEEQKLCLVLTIMCKFPEGATLVSYSEIWKNVPASGCLGHCFNWAQDHIRAAKDAISVADREAALVAEPFPTAPQAASFSERRYQQMDSPHPSGEGQPHPLTVGFICYV